MKRFIRLAGLLTCAAVMLTVIPAASAASEAADSYLIGDADGNGVIDINDVTTIQRLLAQLIDDPDGMIAKRSQLTGDELDISSATEIQRFLGGYENTYHIGETVELQQPATEAETTKPVPTRDPYELPFIPAH